MKIQVQHIPSSGLELAFRKEAETFPVLKTLITDGQCRFVEPITIQLTAAHERDMVRVDGAFATVVQLLCSRCLEAFQTPLQRRFTLRFSRQIPTDLHPDHAEAVALTADQIGLVFFEGEEIDLTDTVQEQVVLALPFKPLCSADCKGLCPHCGIDRNFASCQCGGAAVTSPFAVLKGRHWPKQ